MKFFSYYYNVLRERPLIKMTYRGGKVVFCPLPTLLFWRVTGGIYYEICGAPGFSGPFGESFQKYVHDVLSAAAHKRNFKLLSEREYGQRKARKHTVDWILTDADDAALFIECKTKRLSWRSRIALTDLSVVEADLQYLAEAVVQLYKTILDYRDGLYPQLEFSNDRAVYPLVVTLENWNLFGPTTTSKLDDLIRGRIAEIGLDQRILDEMPYAICSIEELETAAQVINEVGIPAFMEKKIRDSQMRLWAFVAFSSYLAKEIHFKVRALFGDEFHEIFNGFDRTQ